MNPQELKKILIEYCIADLSSLIIEYVGSTLLLGSINHLHEYEDWISRFITSSGRGYILNRRGNLSIYNLDSGILLDLFNVGSFSDLAVLNNEIYLIGHLNHVLVLSPLGERIRNWDLEEVNEYNYHMTVFRNELYIHSIKKASIDVFSPYGQYQRTIKCDHSLENFIITKDLIVDTGSVIRILTLDGKEITCFKNKGYPDSVVANGEIYLNHGKNIKVYSFDGSFIRSFDFDFTIYRISHSDGFLYLHDHEKIYTYEFIPDILIKF